MCLGIPAESVFETEIEVSADEPSPLLTAAARRRIKQRLRRKMDKQSPEVQQPVKMTLELDTLCPSVAKNAAGQDVKKPAMPAAPLAPLRSAKPQLEVTKTEAPILASFAPTALGSTMLVPVCALPIVMQVEEKQPITQINASHLAMLPFEKQLPVQQDSWNTDDEMDASTADTNDSALTTTSAKSSSNGQLFDVPDFRCPVHYTVRKTFIELDDEDLVPECSRKRASSAPPPHMQEA
mmetsp:Transcript_72735/g.135910  ORF Transcript_72735/g.135910 Transcript_72735/m.135910 type:complete len:238 (-) Transcript_72735:146-859(-)